VRAGTHALTLLSVPLNVHVLTALAEEPKSLIDLRRAVGSPPQTTMRGHMRELTRLGVLERRRHADFPGTVDFELGPAGRDLIGVVHVLQSWLSSAPYGPLQPGSVAARSAIKALAEGWSSSIVRALAAQPLSLTELNQLISSLNYPSLERRLSALRLTGQIEPCPNGGRSTPYVATDWLRRAIAPLAAAARWERKHAPEESAPIGRLDIESAFLLSVPMLRISPELSGACRLAVYSGGGGEHRLAGVVARIKEGRVVSCTSRLEGDADAWATGSAAAWLRAVMERAADHLEVGGDTALAAELISGLPGALFSVRERR
jgi:DNA-binding HxlR family transcriptional regulator